MTKRNYTRGKAGNLTCERRNTRWRTNFIEALACTSNITAAADAAGINKSLAYAARRKEPEFAAHWIKALCEGYDLLEMELLGYLRNPDPDRKMDVANALRVLAGHREAVARQRALIDDRDEQEVLDSIDAMIDEMRQRSAANAKLIADGSKSGADEK
ncbi:MAG: hypothetical protein ABL914_11680 [Novosphingobium sp.]|uniref:hypothetical protein n=1 Tax=Novosphingobium sp. TaxID=1874826 RepID=UPI0032BD044A